VDRASDFGTEGSEFESDPGHFLDGAFFLASICLRTFL
jgi:hypothetical protein